MSSIMAYKTLEVTLISAVDLKDVNLFSKMEVYAVVFLSSDPGSQQRTPPDREGGLNPAWNSTLRFNVRADNYDGQDLRILLRAKRSLGDRDVGEVRIPLSELLHAGPGPKFDSYQVRKCTSDKPKGVLNLSYKVGYPPYGPQPYPPPGGYPGYAPPPPQDGYGYGAAPPVKKNERWLELAVMSTVRALIDSLSDHIFPDRRPRPGPRWFRILDKFNLVALVLEFLNKEECGM